MKPTLPALRWIIVPLLTIVVAFELIQTIVAAVSAEESTGIIFFAAMASLIVGLPNKQYKILTGLMVLLGSIASVAFAGLWSSDAAVAAAFFVVCGLGASLVLGWEDIRPLLIPEYALSHRAFSFVQSIALRVQMSLLSAGLRLRIIGDRVSSHFPLFKPMFSAIGQALILAAKIISVTLRFLAYTAGLALSFAVKVRGVSMLSARALYHSRASILIMTILFTSVAFSSQAVTWRSEYVNNRSFDRGFDNWAVPKVRYRDESFRNDHWYLPGENCLTMTVYSRRGLSYDRVAVFQPLDVELSWGAWTVSGYMGNVDVQRECDTLATSITIVLRDNAGETRYLKYAVFVMGELASNSTEGIVEVGRGGDLQVNFERDLISSIWDVWNIPFILGWKVIGVELLVEFWNNWGDGVHLEAVFDGISLRRESDLRWPVRLAGFALWWLPIVCLPMLVWTHSRMPEEERSQ